MNVPPDTEQPPPPPRFPPLRRAKPFTTDPQTVMLAQHRKQRKAKLTVGSGWKTFKDNGPGERTVLFWSGGKDSFLTLRALQQRLRERKEQERITLLTTFDGKTGKIPFQDTKVRARCTADYCVMLSLLVVVHSERVCCSC